MTVWFVRKDSLVPRRREVPSPATGQSVAKVVSEGVTGDEASSGLRSAIPDTALIAGADVSGGIATVQLTPEFGDIPARDQVLALGQLVLTLTDLRGVGRVQFQIDGVAAAVPLPDGTSKDDSVARDDFVALTDAT